MLPREGTTHAAEREGEPALLSARVHRQPNLRILSTQERSDADYFFTTVILSSDGYCCLAGRNSVAYRSNIVTLPDKNIVAAHAHCGRLIVPAVVGVSEAERNAANN